MGGKKFSAHGGYGLVSLADCTGHLCHFTQQCAAVALTPVQRVHKDVFNVTIFVIPTVTDRGVLITYQHHTGRMLNSWFILQDVAKPLIGCLPLT